MRYDSHRKLYLDEENSANVDEKMWLLNPIIPGILKMVRGLFLDRVPFQRLSEPIVFNAINVVLDQYKERLITRSTPRTFLQGRKIVLLEELINLATRFGLQTFVPPGPPKNIFGLAFVQNETVDVFEIWTGLSPSVDKFGDVKRYKGSPRLNVWQGRCNIINGTNGELFKPFLQEGRSLKIFLAPLCRTLTLDPVGDEPVVLSNGIRSLEYEFSPRVFMGARNNPNNKCL